MSCIIEIDEPIQLQQVERACPTCRYKVTNVFLSKCPRCTSKLQMASLCMGCLQNGVCHGEESKIATPKKQFFGIS